MKRFNYLWVCWTFSAAAVLVSGARVQAQQYTRYSIPELFSYEELLVLSEDEEFPPALARKLEEITTTPFLSNEAYYRGARPHLPRIDKLGRSLRMALWNIERGIYLEEQILALTDPQAFLGLARERWQEFEKRRDAAADEEAEQDPRKYVDLDLEKLREQLEVLQSVDLFVLNEVDWGMKRTDYREVVRELGDALNMNWAYGVEFIEVDPTLLGTEDFDTVEDEEDREMLVEMTQVDKERMRGLHGNAILSRYPIRAAYVRPFELQPYDWYDEEKALRPGEKGIRAGMRVLGDELYREMRRGGRMTLRVDLDVPDLPEGRLTVLTPHLENRTKPKNRQKQMAEVLAWVKPIRNPVIIGGDLNTIGGDAQSLKLERQLVKKYGDADFWVNQGVKWSTGVGKAYDVVRGGVNWTKNASDPTRRHIPFFFPSKEKGLFKMVEAFRFGDGRAFDLRGDKERTSSGYAGYLGNSNERASKGFTHTYQWVITYHVVGTYKLDWIFVKPYLENPEDKSGPYRFAPHFARTMVTLNNCLPTELSDHNPMTVDLPFDEPILDAPKKAKSR